MAKKLGMTTSSGFLIVGDKWVAGKLGWSTLTMKDGTSEKRAQLQHVHDGGMVAWLPGHAHLLRLLEGAKVGSVVRVRCEGQVQVKTPMGSKLAYRYQAEELDDAEVSQLPASEVDLNGHLSAPPKPARPVNGKGRKALVATNDELPF